MVDKSEKFRWLVRLGFAARGLVYLLIGALAFFAGRGDSGPEDAFGLLRDQPMGTAILYLAVLGLLGYGLFRLCSLLFDVEGYGTDAKGIAHRIGHGASGLAHLALAWTAFQIAQGAGQGSGNQAEGAAGTLLSFPFGSLVLGLIGIAFGVAAIMQAKSAIGGRLNDAVEAGAPPIVRPLGRAGYGARSIVFALIGWSLLRSAWFSSTTEVKSLGEAIGSLAGNGLLHMLVAVGLMLFGLFSLLLARYRIVPDVDRSRLKPSFR